VVGVPIPGDLTQDLDDTLGSWCDGDAGPCRSAAGSSRSLVTSR
jgi:hypothetical protein